MGQKKEACRRTWENSGKQAYIASWYNAYFSSGCNSGTGLNANVVDSKKDFKSRKGERRYVKKQKRNGDGSGGYSYSIGNNTGIDIPNTDYPIREYGIFRFKCIRNKKGNEIVEAAIVLPILILIIISLISISVFHYTSFINECSVQKEIVDITSNDDSLMKIVERSKSDVSAYSGFYLNTFRRDYTTIGYVIDEASIIRGGELVGVL